jgi:hypothetical protein
LSLKEKRSVTLRLVNGYSIVLREGKYYVLDADDEVVGGPFDTYEEAVEYANNLPPCPPPKPKPKPKPTPKPKGYGSDGPGM